VARVLPYKRVHDRRGLDGHLGAPECREMQVLQLIAFADSTYSTFNRRKSTLFLARTPSPLLAPAPIHSSQNTSIRRSSAIGSTPASFSAAKPVPDWSPPTLVQAPSAASAQIPFGLPLTKDTARRRVHTVRYPLERSCRRSTPRPPRRNGRSHPRMLAPSARSAARDILLPFRPSPRPTSRLILSLWFRF
jgi:hypothetical protein